MGIGQDRTGLASDADTDSGKGNVSNSYHRQTDLLSEWESEFE